MSSLRAPDGGRGAPRVDHDALIVAMTLVPGAYARNRMFTLFKDPEVRHAKRRASLLRGVVRQLAGQDGDACDVVLERHASADAARLRFRVVRVRYERVVLLSEVETACLVYLCGRAGVSGFQANEGDRALLHAALRRLGWGLDFELDAHDLSG
jgi:hypothetical protein